MIICISIPVMLNEWGRYYDFKYKKQINIDGMINIWISYVIYVWTIICVKCIPDRDLSEL